MPYTKSETIVGNGGKALGLAYTVLAQANFRVVKDGDREAEFVGPRMISGRQNPLNGARCVRIAVRGNRLHLDADLQGVGWLFMLLCGVLVAVGIILTLVMLLSDDPDANPLVLVLPLGIWLILLPVMYWWTRRIVVQAYDTFMANMVAAEKRK
jgi:hypothetical protein